MGTRRLPLAIGGVGAAIVLGLGLGGASLAIGGKHDAAKGVKANLSTKAPKNVIYLLGDGMGVSEVTAARYYGYGAGGRMNVDRLPFTGFNTTWSLKPGAGPEYLPDYDPDSASTGTMWATGRKTIDERISQGPSTAIDVPGENLPTVLELAQKAGKRTGNVSTAEITDATPAVLASHMSLRGCQGPEDAAEDCRTETKAAGGLGSIAEQMVDHEADVTIGGGRARFEQKTDAGPTVVDYAKGLGYDVVEDADGLAAADGSKPLLGLFSPGTMSTEWTGPQATLGAGTPAQKCETGQRPAEQPSLSAMTTKALELLDGSDKGFFLQVEGASIDKQDHAANACAQIGETIAFDDAIGVAMDYQASHPDTLVVVTADHSHTSQIVSEDSEGEDDPTGYSNNLTTADGQTMRVTYGTAGGNPAAATPPSQQHTGAAVPVFAAGPQASAVLGTNDHTDTFALLQGKAE